MMLVAFNRLYQAVGDLPFIPEATRCPICGCVEITTVCRLCGTDKIGAVPYARIVGGKTPFIVQEDPLTGFSAVRFRCGVGGLLAEVHALVAPADPEVGLLFPYTVLFRATAGGVELEVSEERRREIMRPVLAVL
jgi:hypothetical protein